MKFYGFYGGSKLLIPLKKAILKEIGFVELRFFLPSTVSSIFLPQKVINCKS